MLEDEPYNRQANLALKEAAVAAGWPEIGVFALADAAGRETDATRSCCMSWHGSITRWASADREVEIYNRITAADPLDTEALRLGKDASARASMKTGGWTEAESYRDLIKDKELAVSLEQQNRMALTGESLDQQIAETYERHQAEPQNVDFARRLGALYEQKEDFESAIAWFEYAADLTNRSDAGLVRKVSDLGMKRFDHAIAAA